MGKNPCREGVIGRNATSASINATIKKGWGITVNTFANFWGRKLYDGYSITLVLALIFLGFVKTILTC